MPREREDLFRQSNTNKKERIIVLAFEGNDTERIYFEDFRSSANFNDELVYLHLLSRPRSDTNSAPNHVFRKLKSEAKDEYNFGKGDELWMIIDTDRWRNIPEIIELCRHEGNMYTAVSNPCFEFWLLLHVKNYDKISDEEKNLLLKNDRISNHKKYIDEYLGNLFGDGYNKTNPRPERFIPFVEKAVCQANKLDVDREDFPTKLGSHVYKVILKISKPFGS